MTGNGILDKIIAGINLLGVLGCLGIFVYTNMIFKRKLPNDNDEVARLLQDAKSATLMETFPIEKITVNLNSQTRRLRFLDMQMHLEPFRPKHLDTFNNYKAQIHDIVIDEGSRMVPEELNSVSGKLIFENRIKKRVNKLFPRPLVKRLFFTTFVVQ